MYLVYYLLTQSVCGCVYVRDYYLYSNTVLHCIQHCRILILIINYRLNICKNVVEVIWVCERDYLQHVLVELLYYILLTTLLL